jgi:hypothetical protein
VQRLILAIVAIVAWPVVAAADDTMADMNMSASSSSSSSDISASLALVAASYSQLNFGGDYEGAVPQLMWMHGRWMAGASIGLYRIFENGVQTYGPGDLMVHGSVELIETESVRAGVAVMASAPTGNMYEGFGMGGPMLMPSAWASWKVQRVTLSGSGGWGGMLAGGMSDDTGKMMMMSIINPMNQSELEWSAAADVAIASGVHGGVGGSGGIPVGESGIDRVIGAVRLGWGKGRIDTSAELQVGFVGDPFKVRGLVETGLHF